MQTADRSDAPAQDGAYAPGPAYDEAFAAGGAPRPHYAALLEALDGIDLHAAAGAVAARLRAAGVAFGDDEDADPFVVDPLPRLLTAAEWAEVEAGIAQRVRALNAFVADVYGERRIVAAGIVPERVLESASYYEPDLRGAAGLPATWVAIAGLDVVRDSDGRFRVLEDNLRTPSGMAYALAARAAVRSDATADIGPGQDELGDEIGALVRRVVDAARPAGGADGACVLLSDGPSNSAWYEHEVLARLAGIPLVTHADLRRRGDALELRAGGRPVSVVYRRTDGDRLRDADGRPTAEAELLLAPLLAGNLGLVNAFGTGVADDKRVHCQVEEMVRFYLGEEPAIASVHSFDLAIDEAREEALDRLDELVVKPRDGHGGAGVLIGPRADAGELRAAAAAIRADPEGWIAQDTVLLSTHPTVVDGRLRPRHVDLRPFAFFDGSRTAVLRGGLTRFARPQGSLIVNSSRDGGGKDTWVLR